jgi:hypothetical protein
VLETKSTREAKLKRQAGASSPRGLHFVFRAMEGRMRVKVENVLVILVE